MSDSISQVSEAPSQLTMAEMKNIKKDIKRIKDRNEMVEFIAEHDLEIDGIKTSLLNAWLQLPDYKFYRIHGRINIMKCDDKTRFRNIKALSDRLDALEKEIKAMVEGMNMLIAKNNLHV